MTRQQLVRRVMLKLRALDAAEDPTPRDEQDILSVYDEQYQLLLADGLVSWGATDDIPTDCAGPVSEIVAAEVADNYAAPPRNKEAARRELSRILSAEYVSAVTPFESF